MKIRLVIRDKDIKIRKKQALLLTTFTPSSKPFKNKKLYSRLKIHKADFWYF